MAAARGGPAHHGRALGLGLLLAAVVLAVPAAHGRMLRSVTPQGAVTGAPPSPSIQANSLGTQSLWEMMQGTIIDFCYNQTSSTCDLDFTLNSTDYARAAVSTFPSLAGQAVNVTVGNNPVTFDTRTAQVSNRTFQSFQCPYSDFAGVCMTSQQTIKSNTITNTSTSSWTFQGKVGGVVRYSYSPPAGIAGPSMMAQVEATFDWGYSFGSASAEARMNGEATINTVAVPMDPADNACVVVILYVNQVQQNGVIEVFAELDGYVAVNQAPGSRAWTDADPRYVRTTGTTHLVWLPYLIQVAQRYGLASAAGYTLQTDAAGNPTSVRLFTPIYVSLTAAVNGYANPQKYDKNSKQCQNPQVPPGNFIAGGSPPPGPPAPPPPSV